jgi:hypothetical protein
LEDRKASAKERQLEYNRLTIQERIARLDKKFGKGLGAAKERAKLQKKLEAPKESPKQETNKESPKRKHVKKG